MSIWNNILRIYYNEYMENNIILEGDKDWTLRKDACV